MSKLREIGRCMHGMTVYKDTETNEVRCFCSYCNPPSRDKRKRLQMHNTKSSLDYMDDETLDRLKNSPYRLTFTVPEWAVDEFHNDYVDCTGEMPEEGQNGIYYVNAKTKHDKYWYSGTVEFEYNVDNKFGRDYDGRIKPSKKDGWVKIHCIHLCGFLLANGFRTGSNK